MCYRSTTRRLVGTKGALLAEPQGRAGLGRQAGQAEQSRGIRQRTVLLVYATSRWGPLLALIWLLATAAPNTIWGQEEAAAESESGFRRNEILYQLDEAVSTIASSLNQIVDQVVLLAINSVHFGAEFDRDFQHKARVIFLEQLFDANPAIKLVNCQECQRLQTKITRGVLQLRKGIPSGEARQEIARELGVDGFIDIGVFRDHGELTVYLQVFEAETGALILVDEQVGLPAPQREAVVLSLGELTIPIDSVSHRTVVFGARESVQFSERFSFGIELALFFDNNQYSPDVVLELKPGALLSPTLGYDLIQFSSGVTRLVLYAGMGKLVSPQLGYGNLGRLGTLLVVDDTLEIQLGFNWFQETALENDNVLRGSGYDARFGYRF